jgi:hypothetical protein
MQQASAVQAECEGMLSNHALVVQFGEVLRLVEFASKDESSAVALEAVWHMLVGSLHHAVLLQVMLHSSIYCWMPSCSAVRFVALTG